MSDKSRRNLLKSIAAGSGAVIAGKSLPESWSKPVVDSVMLPAHAQTSMLYYYERNTQQTVAIWLEKLNSDRNLLTEVMDTVVSRAEAQPGFNDQTDWCVEVNGNVATITVVNNNSDAMWKGDIPTDGTLGTPLPNIQENCDRPPRTVGGQLSIVNYTYGDPTMTIMAGPGGSGWQVTLPIAPTGCGDLDPLGECNSQQGG
jgi:hypothetical protein